MNIDLIFQILQLALGIAQVQSAGKVQQDAAIADNLVQIVKSATQAYEQHTGLPLDPDLIKAEDPII
jgi:hypothetical protein